MKIIKERVKQIISIIFYILPIINNKIIFDNFAGRGYGDNPKYIAEEILKQNLNWDLVWIVADINENIPKGIRKVRCCSIEAMYELITAKVWIDNIRNAYHPKKRKNQIYIQTWHGSLPAKPIEGDVEHLLEPIYVKAAKLDGKITDAILTDSSMMEEIYRRCFWLGKDVEYLRFGMPRTDFILQNADNKEIIENVRKEFNIGKNAYVILYAPTFRDDNSADGYIVDFDKILSLMKNIVHKDCTVLVKFHPNDIGNKNIYEYTDNLIDGSDYPDIQKLCVACDCLITDYSSTAFDFTLLGKPVFIYAGDIDNYKKMRGLTKEYYEWPYPKAYNMDEMLNNIKTFDDTEYKRNVEEYLANNNLYDTGNAAKQTVEWISKHLSTNR